MTSERSAVRRPATLLALVLSGGSFIVSPAAAHDDALHCDALHCDAVMASVEDAGFADEVEVSCTGGHAVLTSDTYPDHALMTGIVNTNEQIPVPAPGYAAPIPLAPTLTDSPLTRDAALGVAVNGVPIFDYTGGGEMSEADLFHHQTQHDTLLTQQLDVCGGHAGRGDDYHYHVKPVCMIERMANTGGEVEPIIGWGFDGFPIYGDLNPDGSPIPAGTLDVCNGQPDETFGYRYHTSTDAPYIVQCLMGATADARDLPRAAPLGPAAGGPGKSPGRPPRGGVENLVFAEDDAGHRRMDYRHDGEDYYMSYAPTATPDCYAFETKTVTAGGEIETGEYCR